MSARGMNAEVCELAITCPVAPLSGWAGLWGTRSGNLDNHAHGHVFDAWDWW